MEHKQIQESQTEQASEAQSTDGRRKFLRKATAGALIATIPAKSVWATGLTNSVVASGHGSDMAGGMGLVMRSAGYWSNNLQSIDTGLRSMKFSDINAFGGKAFLNSGLGTVGNNNVTFEQILTERNPNNNSLKWRGANHVNRWMVSAYLNAYYTIHVGHGSNFPVVGMNRNFPTLMAFGDALYNMASPNPGLVGTELKDLHMTA